MGLRHRKAAASAEIPGDAWCHSGMDLDENKALNPFPALLCPLIANFVRLEQQPNQPVLLRGELFSAFHQILSKAAFPLL